MWGGESEGGERGARESDRMTMRGTFNETRRYVSRLMRACRHFWNATRAYETTPESFKYSRESEGRNEQDLTQIHASSSVLLMTDRGGSPLLRGENENDRKAMRNTL